MATVPEVAYLGDRYDYIDWLGRWGGLPYYTKRTFQDGAIGEIAQNGKDGNTYTDGFDENAGGSTYSDEVLFNGRQVCKSFIPQGSLGALSLGGSLNKNLKIFRGQTLWVQCAIWVPSEFDFNEAMAGGGGMKFMRQRVTDDSYNVGHSDIYINAPDNGRPGPFKLVMESHTAKTNGHDSHNSNIDFGDVSQWDIPREEWVNVQYAVTHDIGHYAESRCRVRVWVGDDLRYDDNSMHSMIGDTNYVNYIHFITYFNANNNHPDSDDYDPNGGPHGVTKDMWLYFAEVEATTITPSYTDADGNHKLPPMEAA